LFQNDESYLKKENKIFPAMGAIMNCAAYGSYAPKALKEVQDIAVKFESLFSKMKEESDISCINNAGGAWVNAQEHTGEILRQALLYAQKTDGMYEPAIAPLTDLWDIKRKMKNKEAFSLPDENSIKKAIPKCDWRNIEMRDERCFRALNGARIDLGGIAKGYTLDKIGGIFKQNEISSALLSFGSSSVAVFGTKPDGNFWKVGLKAPDCAVNEYFAVVSLKDKFLSVSGDYEQYFIKNAKRYHHIINSKTGYPSESGLRSVTVISDNAALSEAYSTALFIMGIDEALSFHKRTGGFEAVFVTADKQVLCTQEIKNNFEFKGTPLGYSYKSS
jgi:thiamine biosynthesis lipoprotein